MAVDRIAYIKERYNVLDYAKDVLGLSVQKSGDRCVSLAPDSHNLTAMIVFDDWWYDFKQGCGGDVIDLCAIAKHDGNKGAAIRELAGDYGYNENWKQYTDELKDKIAYWQSQLTDTQLRYLRKRRIYKKTVERLKLGYNPQENRLIIPYQKNGYIAYYIGRDMSGNPNVSKYKKAYLNGLNENVPWGLQTFEEGYREKIFADSKPPFADSESESANEDLSPQQKSENLPQNDVLRSLADKKKISDKYIIIAEGAFDAMSFEQEGFRVLSPISGYFNKESLKYVVKLLKTAECVFVCFDNDKAGSKFTLKMCQVLFKNRIKFVCGILPEGVKDVSEYYADHNGDLYDLVENAVSGFGMLAEQITDKDEFKKFVFDAARFVEEYELVEFFDNVRQFPPKWLAAILKKALKVPPEVILLKDILDKHVLKYVEKVGFYEYRHGVWIKLSENSIGRYFADILGQWFSGSKLGSLEKALKAMTTTDELFNRKPLFNFRNCVLELETGKVREHRPDDLSSIQVKYDYNPEAKCPQWDKFISEIMADREASIKLLQEMAGYILFDDCFLEKCFFLIGDGANGKSVFLNVISAVFDEANISHVEMATLDNEFQRINLLDSLANISTETSTKIEEAASYFKQIVAGDPINGCYKGKDSMNFRPRCVMISACNEYIQSKDTTDGFLRRICFIDFPCKFEGKKADVKLESKLKEELPGIFNWVYEGYKRLEEQQSLTETPEQKEMLHEFVQISNPVAAFIEEALMSKGGLIDRTNLYRDYQRWTREAGHEALSRTKFIRVFRKTIKKHLPDVTEKIVDGIRFFDFGEDSLE